MHKAREVLGHWEEVWEGVYRSPNLLEAASQSTPSVVWRGLREAQPTQRLLNTRLLKRTDTELLFFHSELCYSRGLGTMTSSLSISFFICEMG